MKDRALNLAQLIRQRQDETGWSYHDIALRSDLSKAKIGQLALPEQPHMPRPETLRKLSVGLEVPLDVVQSAAMESAGITQTSTAGRNQRIALIIALLRDLSPRDLALVEVLIASIVSLREHEREEREDKRA